MEGFFLDPGLEVLDDLIIDVGLEKGQADHLQGLAHVFFGDFPLALEEFHRLLQAVGELVEHGMDPLAALFLEAESQAGRAARIDRGGEAGLGPHELQIVPAPSPPALGDVVGGETAAGNELWS